MSQVLFLLCQQPSEDAMPTELPVKKTMARKERVSRYAPVDSSRLTVKQKPAQKSQAEQKPKQKQHAKLQRDDQMASDEGNSSDEETEITAHTKPFVSNTIYQVIKSPSLEHGILSLSIVITN